MKEIELLKTIFKDSPDILEPLNEIDKEIERLNNIIKEVREYILQNCEIIRYKDEDTIGRVEGIPLLEILDKETK